MVLVKPYSLFVWRIYCNIVQRCLFQNSMKGLFLQKCWQTRLTTRVPVIGFNSKSILTFSGLQFDLSSIFMVFYKSHWWVYDGASAWPWWRIWRIDTEHRLSLFFQQPTSMEISSAKQSGEEKKCLLFQGVLFAIRSQMMGGPIVCVCPHQRRVVSPNYCICVLFRANSKHSLVTSL